MSYWGLGLQRTDNQGAEHARNAYKTHPGPERLWRSRNRVVVAGPRGFQGQFTVKQFWGLFAVQGKFDRFEGCIDIGERGSVGGSLVVNAGSVITASARADEHLRSAGLFSTGWDPVIVFQSRYYFLWCRTRHG